MARIHAKDLPKLLLDIDGYTGRLLTRYAMQLMALTLVRFVRTTELIQAPWEEIDLEGQRWEIPASRMKMKDPHVMPLPRQAVELLTNLKELTDNTPYLFPHASDPRKTMSNNTILFALYRMGYKGKMTEHGSRGVASTIMHDPRTLT